MCLIIRSYLTRDHWEISSEEPNVIHQFVNKKDSISFRKYINLLEKFNLTKKVISLSKVSTIIWHINNTNTHYCAEIEGDTLIFLFLFLRTLLSCQKFFPFHLDQKISRVDEPIDLKNQMIRSELRFSSYLLYWPVWWHSWPGLGPSRSERWTFPDCRNTEAPEIACSSQPSKRWSSL